MLPMFRRARTRRPLARVAAVATCAVVGAALVTVAPVTAGVTPEWRQEAEAFAIKTVGAQFSDANASGGQAWNLWTNGYLQTNFNATTSGAKQVDVVARGNVAAGVWPVMRLYVDGALVSEQSVASYTYQTYSTTLSSVSSGTHSLRIEFTNDATVNGEDRNLKVDAASVVPAGVEEWRLEAESFPTKFGQGQQSSDTNASGSAYYNMWSNGHLETTSMTVPASGTKQIVVYARGQVAGGVWPVMRILVDGTMVAEHSVSTTTYLPYTATTTLSKGSHTLRIQYTNDGSTSTEDRNLKVDVASLVPVPHEWKQEAESFTTKTVGAATTSSLASAGTFWNLWSNGYLETTMAAASSGRKQIRIIARGTSAQGTWPNLRVSLGTTVLANISVNSGTFTQYVVPATMNTGANTLKLQYTNDTDTSGTGEDRNLHLDVVTLVGDNAFPFVGRVAHPANNSYVDARPALRVTYADPDGDAGYVDFEIYNNATGAFVTDGRSASTAAGDVATWVPSTALSNGTQYRWRARAYDGTSYSGAWTANQYFTVDSTAPVAPAVSSATFPSGAWSGTDTTSGAFTFGNGGSGDVVSYKYGIDENPPGTDTAATSVTLTPGEGPHTLYVQSVDRAGNLSPITSYAFNVAAGAVTAPDAGDVTGKRFTLKTAANPSLNGVTYQWRRAATDAWATIPAAHVTASGVPVTWPVVLTNGAHPDLVWDVAATTAGIDGPVEVRAVYSNGASTRGTRVALDQRNAGGATMPVGSSGSVNLLTGNFSLTETDVSVSASTSSLDVSRTFNSRDPQAEPNGAFGPGWASGLTVGQGSSYTRLTASGSLRTVGLATGDTIGFTATSASAFAPEPGMEWLTLTRTAGSGTTDQTDDVYELKDDIGVRTTFTWQSTAFLPSSVSQPGSNNITTYAYETVGGVTRVVRALAPVPSGVTCANPATTRGCRSLTFDYAPASTPVPGSAGGDYPGRLRSVSLTAWNPATSSMATVELARYSYFPSGRLMATWNPALPSLKTTYDYDSNGRLVTLTPPAEQPFTFAYTTLPNDPDGGRLKSYSRSALAAGTATTTFVYDVPVSGTGAPANLTSSELARWGQRNAPVDATAVFPASQVPDGNQAAGILPSSYERASVTYLDVTGRPVNTLTPGGHLSVTEYDDHGKVARELTATNRAAALNASTTDTAAQEAALAMRLSTVRTFSADGRQLLEELGPEHEVTLANAFTDSLGRAWPAGSVVRARSRTVNTYDEGAPAGTGPYDLVTTSRTGARIADTTADADVRTTTATYDWNLLAPLTRTTDPGGLNLVHRASYDASGLVTKETRPGGTAAQDTAQTTVRSYYTAGAHPAHADCGNRPEWANLLCRTEVAAQPAVTTDRPAIPATVYEYDLYQSLTATTDKIGTTTVRATTVTYDSAHRPWRTTTTGVGVAIPTVENYYDPSTGKPTEVRVLDAAGAVTSRITRVYDSLGRLTSYTDADGNTSTTTYDLMSRLVSTNDGKGTQTRYYDEGSERRGLLTRIVDSAAGTFSATYDAEGRLATETLPNGLVRAVTRDAVGNEVSATYTKGTSTWLSFTASPSVHRQWLAATSSALSSQSFVYDPAGRLTQVADTSAGGGCSLRTYAYDADSNRTSLVTRAPDSEGDCDPAAAGTTTTWTYDAASRLTAAGYGYDAAGRTTSVPAGDGGGAAMTATYYVNDTLRTLTPQDGATRTFTFDPTANRYRSWSDGTTTRVNHYAGDNDSPVWVDEGGGAWTRNITGIGGGLAAVQDSANGVVLQLSDLRGNVVATATTDTTATGPLATFDSTEFGSPRGGTTRRYGWLGTRGRMTDSSGVVLLGARVYNPNTGRFLQVDPVKGGSANDYEYGAGDPVNSHDATGLSPCMWSNPACARYDGWPSHDLAFRVFFWFSASEIASLQREAKANRLDKRGLNWDTDGCTSVGGVANNIVNGAFDNACARHDFGYGNHRKIFADPTYDKLSGREEIDRHFLADMRAACNSRWPFWHPKFAVCHADAKAMHTAVRAAGWWWYWIKN